VLKLDMTLKSFFQNLQDKALEHSAQILYCDFCVVGHMNNFRSFIGEALMTLHSSHLPLISLKSVQGGRHKRKKQKQFQTFTESHEP